MTVLLLSGGAVAWAVSAAGDGQHVWLAQPWDDEAGTWVAHHGPGDGPDALATVREVTRTVAPGGVAARGATLYVLYTNGTMQTFAGERIGLEQPWRYQAQSGPSLPRGVVVRDFAVGRGGPWALVRVDDAAALRRLDALDADPPTTRPLDESQMMRNLRLGLPPNMDRVDRVPADETATPEAPDTATATEAPDADEPSLPVDRLLRLQTGRWKAVALPDNWPTGERARLTTSSTTWPALAVEDGASLRVYQWEGDEATWREQAYDVPVSEQWAAALVGGHLTVAWQTSAAEAEALQVEVAVLRHGRVRPIGTMALAGSHRTWDVAGTEAALWLVGQHTQATRATEMAGPPPDAPAPPWRWTAMDLQGSVVTAPEALRWREPPGMGTAADYYIMVGVLVSAVLLMLLFWRRDAAANHLDLPATLVLGALGRRFAAGAADLLPAVLLVMSIYGLSLPELMMRWPGGGTAASWEAIAPGVLVVGLFVLYTTFAELIMQRTVGKLLVGLRVTNLQGQRPRVWQLLVRNALKSFDLVAWPLLILLVLGPYRQRLGDLVARTVVVTPAQRDADNAPDKSSDDKGERKDDR